MTQFLAFLFLLLMAIPALIAVSVGSRSLLGFLWNGMWFYIIGQTAQVAFDSPDAQGLGIFLSVLFIWRSLVFRRRSPFTFRATQFPGGNFRFGNVKRPEYPRDPVDMREVIEAEVIATERRPLVEEDRANSPDATGPQNPRKT